MIELKNVSKFYKDNNMVTVGLRNVNLKLNKGELVAITGDSGSGKSTLLNVISLIDSYDEGEILFYGNETFYFNQNDSDTFRKDNVSFIFQKYNIIDSYTVLQNVMLPLIINGESEESAKAKATEIIKRVGLEHRINNKGTKLSGGEKQRCVIARALAKDTPILACDEPTGNLDSKTSKEIIDLIKEVSKDRLVLIVTHDYESIKDICTRKIKLSDGEIVEDVTFSEGEQEDNKELVLESKAPLKKTLFKLAISNILSTPKKTILSVMVFMFVSCVLMLLSLLMVRIAYDENYTYNQSYSLVSKDRLIIYDINKESLDMNKLSNVLKDKEYYIDAYYEELYSEIKTETMYDYANLTFRKFEYNIMNGEDADDDGEYVLILPEYRKWSVGEYELGEFSVISELAKQRQEIKIGNIVGVGVSEYVDRVFLVGYKYNQQIVNIYINNNINLCIEGEDGREYLDVIYNESLPETYIAIPENAKDKYKDTSNLKNYYNVHYDIEVVYSNKVMYPTFYANKDYIEGKIEPKLDCKEIVVYTEDVNQLSRQITKLGYKTSMPGMIENKETANLFILYILIGVIVLALFMMFFITYAVIQRIYLTKRKDYSIFRTLGLVSKDLKKVLNIEVLITVFTSTIFGASISILLDVLLGMELLKYMSVILGILYVMAMLVFGLAISTRLKNKIFNNTVFQAIKEGSE